MEVLVIYPICWRTVYGSLPYMKVLLKPFHFTASTAIGFFINTLIILFFDIHFYKVY